MPASAVHATDSDAFTATLRCHAPNSEVYTLGLSRTRVALLSYEDDAILAAVETWADTVPAPAPEGARSPASREGRACTLRRGGTSRGTKHPSGRTPIVARVTTQ